MKLSIIIPLAPEETFWQQLLPQLTSFNDDTEVLFVTSSTKEQCLIEAAIEQNRELTRGVDPVFVNNWKGFLS